MAFPGSPTLVKGALVHLATPGGQPGIIAFPYNPETLCRTLVAAPAPQSPGAAPAAPQETIVFTLALDATDALGLGDAQAAATGVYPVLSAIEFLMSPAATGAGTATLFVWGENRIVPVRVTGLRIVERLFNPNLSPVQVSVEVTLVVAEPSGDNDGTGYLAAYAANLAALASPAYTGLLAPLGLSRL